MPIKVVCPGCKKALNAPDNLAGKKVRCPGCQAVIEVPAALKAYQGETRVAAKPPSATAPPRHPTPAAPAPPSAPAAPAPPAEAAGKGSVCPKCKKTLPGDTIICVDCGINIRTGDKLNTSIG